MDNLIGKTLDAAPSENAVSISAKHAMAQIVITLAAGKGFSTASLAPVGWPTSIRLW